MSTSTLAAKHIAVAACGSVTVASAILYYLTEGNATAQRRKAAPNVGKAILRGSMLPSPPSATHAPPPVTPWAVEAVGNCVSDPSGPALCVLVGPRDAGQLTILNRVPTATATKNMVAVDAGTKPLIDAVFQRLTAPIPTELLCLGGNFRYPIRDEADRVELIHEVLGHAKDESTGRLPCLLIDASNQPNGAEVEAAVFTICKGGQRCKAVVVTHDWARVLLRQDNADKKAVVFVGEPSLEDTEEYLMRHADPDRLNAPGKGRAPLSPQDIDALIRYAPRRYDTSLLSDYLDSEIPSVDKYVEAKKGERRETIRERFNAACGIESRDVFETLVREKTIALDVVKKRCPNSDHLFDAALLAPARSAKMQDEPHVSWQFACDRRIVAEAPAEYKKGFTTRPGFWSKFL